MRLEYDWAEDALCKGADPEIFYNETDPADVRKAKATCAECPVKELCLADAFRWEKAAYARFGVWGGMTSTERRSYIRKLRRQRLAS